jgi:AbrB family looped-hinge helix DNA binding protein
MPLATITPEGQLTIPQEVRDALGWSAGDRVVIEAVEGVLVAKPRSTHVMDLAGMLGKPPHGAGATIEDMDEAVGQAIADHVVGPR